MPGAGADASASVAPIDCDIHVAVPKTEVLFPYLPEHWRAYIRTSAFKGVADTSYPRGVPTSARPGTAPPSGPPGSDLDLLREHTLDAWGATHGVLNCDYGVQSIHNPDLAAATASAVNDWLVQHWLEKEPRLRASLVVPTKLPEAAVREIERVGAHAGFVQVFLPVLSETPYGNRIYWPIYEAAVRHHLAIAIQPGASAGSPSTGVGWPTYYVEEYVGVAQVFQTQLVSLIAEGVFDQFPSLRVVMVEGGWTWLPPLMWRFDKDWKGVRREIPWVRRPPSEYVRQHVRFTLQPLDAPPEPRWLLEVIEQMGSEELLMFGTDYPHWHFDTPEQAVPAGLPDGLRRKILSENARAFYCL